MTARPVLTAAETRAAEAAAIAAGTSVEALMDRAGIAAAEAIRRYAGRVPALVLCGPGNNGGDGYVVARRLAECRFEVRVAAFAEPASDAARAARQAWKGPVGAPGEAEPAPLLIDALFGTGLSRPLDEAVSRRLGELAGAARVRVAIDLPSGVATDDGAILSPVPYFDLTITFASLKPSHLLQPAARHMGRLVVADIGVAVESRLERISRPATGSPGPDDHKYSRGYVAVLAGEMPGAAALAAAAAARAGAGYVRILTDAPLGGVPAAVVQPGSRDLIFADDRIGMVVAGPGLGRGKAAREAIKALRSAATPRVFDADALWCLGPDPRLQGEAILTPHEGEFRRLFPHVAGSKVEKARQAAARSAAVVVYKGADTVVAAPDGRAAIAGTSSPWLSTAGTGDVLTGIVAAMRGRFPGSFEAACAAVWLHARAAELAGPALIADDLLLRLPDALSECLA